MTKVRLLTRGHKTLGGDVVMRISVLASKFIVP